MIEAQRHRVVITGFGAITASGNTIEETWRSIQEGRSGIAKITQWDTRKWKFSLGGEIKNYQPQTLIQDRKILKLISRQDVIGLNAVSQALDHSTLLNYRNSLSDATDFNNRTGVFVGSPGNRFHQQYDFMPLFSHAKGDMKKFAEGLFEHIHPMWLLRILPNNVLAYTGILHGFKGVNENVANHAVSGIQAIGEAYRYLQQGQIDQAVVVAYESAIEPEGQTYYGELNVLSETGLFPFDQSHNGTVLAEGAGAFILETLEAAQKRKATIYGEILGNATTSEAMGVFPIREDADGLIRALEAALAHAQVNSDDIGMITAHGNGTKVSDTTEAIAINHCFNNIPVTGFKWALGHSLTAAGIVESILTLISLRENSVPGIATLERKAPECNQLNVAKTVQKPRSSLGLLITRGFASINSCLILKAGL